VEPSSTQVQQASPKEASNAPTEQQEKNLHEEEEGAPPSIPDIPTASNSSQDQDQPTHEVNDDVVNDDQGQSDGQDGDKNDQDYQVIPQISNEEIKAHCKRRIERSFERSGHTLERVIGDLRGNVSTRSQLAKFSNHQTLSPSVSFLHMPLIVILSCNKWMLKVHFLMVQPLGFEDLNFPNHVYKLHKVLYGLKQAPRAWYEHLRELLLDHGFEDGQIDPTLFTKMVNGELFVCQLYVDDIIFGSTNKAFNDEFSQLMIDRFEMFMMGETKFFLGFEIKQLKEGTFINQAKYVQDMLKRFKMKELNGAATPMPTKCHLKLDPNGKYVDQKVYRSMIGSLLYLCASRPDIVLSVCVCARYQATPKEST
jgi:hypothetical protein